MSTINVDEIEAFAHAQENQPMSKSAWLGTDRAGYFKLRDVRALIARVRELEARYMCRCETYDGSPIVREPELEEPGKCCNCGRDYI